MCVKPFRTTVTRVLTLPRSLRLPSTLQLAVLFTRAHGLESNVLNPSALVLQIGLLANESVFPPAEKKQRGRFKKKQAKNGALVMGVTQQEKDMRRPMRLCPVPISQHRSKDRYWRFYRKERERELGQSSYCVPLGTFLRDWDILVKSRLEAPRLHSMVVQDQMATRLRGFT